LHRSAEHLPGRSRRRVEDVQYSVTDASASTKLNALNARTAIDFWSNVRRARVGTRVLLRNPFGPHGRRHKLVLMGKLGRSPEGPG